MANNVINRQSNKGKSGDKPGMHYQKRDGDIIELIYEYDGVLAKRHIKERFWPNASERAMLRRLSLLVLHGFLARPEKRQWWSRPIREAIYWIGWRGALWLAAQRGIYIDPPKNEGENQMRKLQRSLREHGIYWLREPRWSMIGHELAIDDFRISFESSVNQIAWINSEQWVRESEFRSHMDTIKFSVEGKNGKIEQRKRGVCPDGLVVIEDIKRKLRGEPHRLPLLLEIDMASHDNSSFARDKVAPYVAYIKSSEFKTRFGLNGGYWLIVTSGERRMKNLMNQTERIARREAPFFFFTTFHELKANILIDPIWFQAGKSNPVSLISGNDNR